MASKTPDLVKIYCGDKPSLPTTGNYKRFGTRAECLRCGFGAGMFQYRWEPADSSPKPPPREQKGCLRVRFHPSGIVRGNQFGSNIPSGFSPRKAITSKYGRIAIWIAIAITLFAVLYYRTPSSLQDKKKDGSSRINKIKFTVVYVMLMGAISAIYALVIQNL